MGEVPGMTPRALALVPEKMEQPLTEMVEASGEQVCVGRTITGSEQVD